MCIEYVGLARNHPESYHSFMWEHLFSKCGIPPQNVHMLDGNAKDLEAECMRYEQNIKKYNGIELFLGGIGPGVCLQYTPMYTLNTHTRRHKHTHIHTHQYTPKNTHARMYILGHAHTRAHPHSRTHIVHTRTHPHLLEHLFV